MGGCNGVDVDACVRGHVPRKLQIHNLETIQRLPNLLTHSPLPPTLVPHQHIPHIHQRLYTFRIFHTTTVAIIHNDDIPQFWKFWYVDMSRLSCLDRRKCGCECCYVGGVAEMGDEEEV